MSSSKKMEMGHENGDETPIDVKPKKKLPDNVDDWPMEIHNALLASLLHYKPIGVNAHFRLVAFMDHLYSPEPIPYFRNRRPNVHAYDISSEDIWKFLNLHYDLKALEATEPPHPMTNYAFTEFSLPDDEYGALIQAKIEKSIKDVVGKAELANSTPDSPPPPPVKTRKTARGKVVTKTAVSEDTESLSSSRSSTPASSGNTTATPVAASTPITRRSRRKD